MKNTNLSSSYLFANKMDIHFNMFSVLMLNRIIKKIHRTDVITIYKSYLFNGTMKFQKKIPKLTRFGDYICHTLIFNFNTRSRESRLLFDRPRNKIVAKTDTIIPCREEYEWMKEISVDQNQEYL